MDQNDLKQLHLGMGNSHYGTICGLKNIKLDLRQNTIGNEGPKLVAADVSAHQLVLPTENKTMIKGEQGQQGAQG